MTIANALQIYGVIAVLTVIGGLAVYFITEDYPALVEERKLARKGVLLAPIWPVALVAVIVLFFIRLVKEWLEEN